MKLFAIYIGGEHSGANIEIHDIRFVAAPSIEDTYAQLRADWWGTPGTLHIDCWAEIDHVDGYDVTLQPAPALASEKLYFVNLGGYDGQGFAEQHKSMFVVAQSTADAKKQALASVPGWSDAHRDELYEADDAFALDAMIGDRLHIHLIPSVKRRPLCFTCHYTPLK